MHELKMRTETRKIRQRTIGTVAARHASGTVPRDESRQRAGGHTRTMPAEEALGQVPAGVCRAMPDIGRDSARRHPPTPLPVASALQRRVRLGQRCACCPRRKRHDVGILPVPRPAFVGARGPVGGRPWDRVHPWWHCSKGNCVSPSRGRNRAGRVDRGEKGKKEISDWTQRGTAPPLAGPCRLIARPGRPGPAWGAN